VVVPPRLPGVTWQRLLLHTSPAAMYLRHFETHSVLTLRTELRGSLILHPLVVVCLHAASGGVCPCRMGMLHVGNFDPCMTGDGAVLQQLKWCDPGTYPCITTDLPATQTTVSWVRPWTHPDTSATPTAALHVPQHSEHARKRATYGAVHWHNSYSGWIAVVVHPIKCIHTMP
jgi:hypothetical protein